MIQWHLIQIIKAADDVSIGNAPTLSGTGVTANNAIAAFLNRIASLLLAVAIPLAIVGVVYAAIALIQASGKPDGYTKARKNLMYVVTGIFLLVFSALIVRWSYNLFQ